MSEGNRRKVALRLGVLEDEIFTCHVCGRKFYIDITGTHDSGVVQRAKADPMFRVSNACGECHRDHYFWPGERYLDEG